MPSEAAPRRLHPSFLIFGVTAAARRLLLPGLGLLLFASGRDRPELWLMALFVPAVGIVLAQYWSYRYQLGADELVIREGLLTRKERHIPYARIQNVDLAQNPLQRWLGVAEARLQTAAGDEPEAVIRVIGLEALEELRLRVLARHEPWPALPAATGDTVAPRRTLLRLDLREVLLQGLISNRGMVVVGAAAGVAWKLDLFDRWFGEGLTAERWAGLAHLSRPGHSLLAAAEALLLILLALVLLRVFSMGLAVLHLYGFRLERSGADLRTEQGLLTRLTKTIPRQRIQTLSTIETPLHRLFGRVSVQVQTAGGRVGEGEDVTRGRFHLAPLAHRGVVAELLREALPDVSVEQTEWKPIAERARRRLFRRSLVLLALLGGGLAWTFGPWSLTVAVALVPLAWVQARLYVRTTAYGLAPGAVLYRTGFWIRRASIARFTKIQALELLASPLDRRAGMARVRIDTASGARAGESLLISYLDAPVAAGLLERLAGEAQGAVFHW